MINIAIDGPSAAGKSTISTLLSKKYNLSHLDTGAMYRIVALKVIRNNISFDDETEIVKLIQNSKIEVKSDGSFYLDGVDVSDEIRNNDISLAASTISKLSKVRTELVFMQQKITKNKGYIVDGRDIGSVVLKDADIKFYLTASSLNRAKRRIIQLKGQVYTDLELQDIQNQIEKRDFQDMNRENSPLTICEDAIIIDSSDLTIEETISLMSSYIDNIIK